MATSKKKKTAAGRSHTPATHKRKSTAAEQYRSDKPSGVDQPGTGQPGDEVVTPADRERIEEQAAEAIEAGAVVPPQPLGVPVEAPARRTGAEDVEREVENQLNHARLEDEPEQHEEDRPSPAPPAH